MTEVNQTPLTPPNNVIKSPEMRVQEVMYGHRVETDQEPYMIVLEALAISSAKPLESVKLDKACHEAFSYDLKQRRKMRYLIFSDRHLEQVAKDDRIPESQKWEVWQAKAKEGFERLKGSGDFRYLDAIFNRDIHALLQTVSILRSQEIDVANRRRWTSRFLAVNGPDMVCDDLREKDWTRDRRFFGRGGELVYLMLNRSSMRDRVGELIKEKLLNPKNPINRIAQSIADPESDPTSGEAKIGYLPLMCHRVYDYLAEDWVNILSTKRLPPSHMFEPLFRMTGLNLTAYFARRGQEIIGADRSEPIIVDAQNGSDISLRESAKEHLNRHRAIANRAVEEHIKKIAEDDGWITVRDQGSSGDARRIIERNFLNKGKNGKFLNDDSKHEIPEEQLNILIRSAQRRHKNNIYTFLLPLTKGIGLVTSRSTGTWFSLNDSLITALVLANVSESGTMELRDFTKNLYTRYGLVIGPEEAQEAFNGTPPVGLDRFRANLNALENRMTRLALTRRFSDDCAFVVNPYRE